ncbi:hypothetical protein [Arthrobacter sp. PAMC25284]|uniref:hypothetical protein n=1 Tax=Arthrobacter sp. PAMC25284 TaxID=2861279 RepID=UPI001C62951C|nr:hypothetical protein [Arthrobacter sp. PAMC25284]QYF89715.1 hypothetical protein KY499_17090 [Arthrobacter sp. PAMC25284]
MAIKLGTKQKLAGDTLIGFGTMVCILGFVIYLLAAFGGGTPNGLVLLGGGVLGLLMICAGYLKRIAVALTATATGAETPDKVNL